MRGCSQLGWYRMIIAAAAWTCSAPNVASSSLQPHTTVHGKTRLGTASTSASEVASPGSSLLMNAAMLPAKSLSCTNEMEMTECHQKTFRSNWALVTIPMTQRVSLCELDGSRQPAREILHDLKNIPKRNDWDIKTFFITSGWAELCTTFSLLQANTVPQ